MRRGYAETPVGRVHYVEDGAGPPVVLLHKAPSSSSQYARVLPLLARTHRAIAIDTPGFGMSDPPPEPAAIEHFAAAVVGVLDALGIARASLVGHHTGASTAVEVAVTAPERVDRLVLCALFAAPDEATREAWRERIDSGIARVLEDYPLVVVAGFPRSARASLTEDADPELLRQELIAFLQAGPRYGDGYTAVIDYSRRLPNVLPRITRPTLVLWPEDDNIPRALGPRVHQLVPGSLYREIPGTTDVTFEDPAGFAAAVVEFLGG